MDGLLGVFLEPYWLPFWVLLIALVIEKKLPWPDKFHPLSLYQLFAIRMAEKVLPSETDSKKQQIISGSLACLVLLLPLCVIIAVLIYLSEYPMFFEGLFLLIALRYQDIDSSSSKVATYLARDKKILARHTSQNILLRETNQLSPLGIIKANCESLILRFSYQYCAVIFWFMLSGGVGALLYRVLYTNAHCWNIKLTRFKQFGAVLHSIVALLQWLPNFLSGLSFLILSFKLSSFKSLGEKKAYTDQRYYLLNSAGLCLNIELGGPAFYEGRKIRSAKCGTNHTVKIEDIKRTQHLLLLILSLCLTLSFLAYTFIFTVLN